MKWEKQANGDWLAQGQKGYFFVWKYGNIWKGMYKHKFGDVVAFRFYKNTLQEIKQFCEENYYWES